MAANGRYRRQVVLTRAASVSGRIFDSDRQPAAKIEVQLLRDTYDALGNRSLTPFDARNFVRTNEKGEYRISGFPPGNYYIRASHAAEPARRTIGALLPTANYLASTYYPGVSAPDEVLPIKIATGADEQAVDFSMEPLSPFKLSGHIVSPLASIPSDRFSFFLVRQDNRVRDDDGLVPDMDGDIERFEFRNVPRDSYDLFVAFRKALTAADPFLVGRTSVNVVDRDVRDLIVTVAPGLDVNGTWKSDDPAAGKRGERGPTSLRPADGLPDILAPEPILHEDGTVEVSQVPPGRYVLSFALPQTVSSRRHDLERGTSSVNHSKSMRVRMDRFSSNSARPAEPFLAL